MSKHLQTKLGRRDVRLLREAVSFYIENKPFERGRRAEDDDAWLDDLLGALEVASGGELRESARHFNRRTSRSHT